VFFVVFLVDEEELGSNDYPLVVEKGKEEEILASHREVD
jgi:hypothetical protein